MKTGRVIAGLLLCAPLLAAAPARAADGDAGIKWRPCPDEETVQCGRLDVPVDWSRPKGERFGVAVARRPAGEPGRRIGSLFINPGGPGGSGVEFVEFADEVFSPEILRRFDIVGLDPRGIGGSHPVLCPEETEPPSRYPSSDKAFKKLVAYNGLRAQECRRLTGALFDHADTSSNVKDIDAVRAALGEEKISFYGVSYGTLMGQQYAEQFPSRVRAMVLDSNMDHSLEGPTSYLLTESEASEESFGRFAAWCATADECAVRKDGAAKVLDELMAKADRGELENPDDPGRKMTPGDLADLVFGAMYDPSAWPELSVGLAALRSGKPARVAAPLGAVEDPYQAILCADFALPVHGFAQVRLLDAASRRVAPHTRVNPLAWTDITGCQGYLSSTRNPQRPYRIEGTPPILMTNSRYDVATPYTWATNVARQVPAAVLLTYDGVGHGDYGRGACTTSAMDRYLLTVRTPPRGTHCPAEPISAAVAKQPAFPFPGPR